MFMKTTTMHRIIVASLLLCGAARAEPCGTNACNWKALERQRRHLGLSEERLETMLEQCRKSGLSAAEANALLTPVRAARDESLPAEAVFTKIEEGLAKKAALDRVEEAARLRLDCLRRANRLVAPVGSDDRHGQGHGGGRQQLILRTAMALESGLPDAVVQAVFDRFGASPRYGRLSHVMEVGETLQLAGFDPTDTRQIMFDCIDHNLNRMEIQRAVDYILRERRKGRDFKAIRADLWG